MAAAPTLKRGSEGPAVRRLQRSLTAAGFELRADGEFGPRTEAAVRAFQRAHRLEVDGIVGPRTWAALRRATAHGDEPPAPQDGRRLSDEGARFIARFEGFSSKLYNDPAGHCTIGYGHLVHRGRCNGTEPADFRDGITRERALELLKKDARTAAGEVSRSVHVRLNQHQFDALVSFVYNVGGGNFRRSTLLKELNAGRYENVPKQLDRWVNAGGRRLEGLVRRRKAEGALFTRGTY